MNHSKWQNKNSEFSNLEHRSDPGNQERTLHGWMGSLRTRTAALSPFGSLEASLQSTALFPTHKEKPEGKRASCAHLKPSVIQVKYSAPPAYGFFFSVNKKVAGSETWLSGPRVLISWSGTEREEAFDDSYVPPFSKSTNSRNQSVSSASSRATLCLDHVYLPNARTGK